MLLSLYRCTTCGTRWLLWPDAIDGGGWNLLDHQQRPGSCCDNVAMGDQIEHLRDIPLTRAATAPQEGRLAVDALLRRRGVPILDAIRAKDSDMAYQVGMLLGDIARILNVNDPSLPAVPLPAAPQVAQEGQP